MSSMAQFKSYGFVVFIAIIFYRWYSEKKVPVTNIEPIAHSYIVDFMSNQTRFKLQKFFENINFHQVQSNWTANYYNDIGEAENANENNQCDNPYLIFNENDNKCMLPVRADVATHYIKSGGWNGWKESAEKLISRMVYFVEYSFNYTNLMEFQEIFESKVFIENAKKVCLGEKKQNMETKNINSVYIRRFQANFILHIPGQNIPMHYDVPFFIGASRYIYPKWLLVVMERSGLFKDRRVPQVQIVTYLHDNNDTNRQNRGGEFLLWSEGINQEPLTVRTYPNSAIFADGTLAVHTTTTLYPNRKNMPIMFDKDDLIELRFDK
eukprot:346676_1